MTPYPAVLESALRRTWQKGTARRSPECIFISSPPRGGSTWVLETIERKINCRRHYEPVRGLLGDPPPFGEGRSGVLRPAVGYEDLPGLEKRIAGVLANAAPTTMKRARSPGQSWGVNLTRILAPEYTLLKFVALSRSLPWVATNFDARGLVILRNPVSLVASAKEMHPRPAGWSQEEVEVMFPASFLDLMPALAHYKRITRIEEIALMYCIDLFFSLSSPAVRRRYMYLVFEEATRRTETVENAIRFLTSGSASPLSRVDNSDLALPSASTLAGTNRTDSRRPRAAAPDRLTSEELSRVVEVSQAVLGDLYHPDGNFNRSSALAADLCLA